jgi:hypothetical protein
MYGSKSRRIGIRDLESRAIELTAAGGGGFRLIPNLACPDAAVKSVRACPHGGCPASPLTSHGRLEIGCHVDCLTMQREGENVGGSL